MNNNPNAARKPNEIKQRSAAAIKQGKIRRRKEGWEKIRGLSEGAVKG